MREKNDEIQERMEKRLNNLELQMKRVTHQRIKQNALRQMDHESRLNEKNTTQQDQVMGNNDVSNQPTETAEEIITDTTGTDISVITDLTSSFKSDYATKINNQYAEMNAAKDNTDKNTKTTAKNKSKSEQTTDKAAAKNVKVRGMKKLRKWFGDDSSESETSDNETVDDSGWDKVKRKEVNIEKKKKQELKRTLNQKNTAIKAQHIIGLGPISPDSYRIP